MTLQEDLLKLDTLDIRVVKAIDERDGENLKLAISEYETLRKSIRIQLLDQSVTAFDDAHAAALFRKITKGDGLPTDKLIRHLITVADSGQLPEEFGAEELDALGSALFYSWFSHIEYVNGLAELRPLVIRTSVGENIDQLIRQIKACYAFQQYGATYSLCRTLIEASIRDICVRCQLMPDLDDDEILSEKFTWKQLREKVSSGSDQEQLKLIYSSLSEVLHGRKLVSKDETRHAFENTLQVVERLYTSHGF